VQVVSADESGTICTWNIQTGALDGHFSRAHGASNLTALAFDANERRLLTAGADGKVRCWNFNSGSLLKSFRHAGPASEISALLFIQGDDQDVGQVRSMHSVLSQLTANISCCG